MFIDYSGTIREPPLNSPNLFISLLLYHIAAIQLTLNEFTINLLILVWLYLLVTLHALDDIQNLLLREILLIFRAHKGYRHVPIRFPCLNECIDILKGDLLIDPFRIVVVIIEIHNGVAIGEVGQNVSHIVAIGDLILLFVC